MAVLLQSILSGVLIGGVYALIGIGLTLIFGVMRVINFAQGELVMIGMYCTFFLFKLAGIDPFLSVVAATLKKIVLGAILQLSLIDRVLDALPQNQILLTIGIGLVLSNTAMLAFTSDYRILSTTYSSSSVALGSVRLSTPLLYCFLITSAITAALYWFLARTDTGHAIRATAQDRDAAQLMGVNVGATLGGVLIGMSESLSAVYIASGMKELCVYVIFLLVLLLKPSGLLGKSRV